MRTSSLCPRRSTVLRPRVFHGDAEKLCDEAQVRIERRRPRAGERAVHGSARKRAWPVRALALLLRRESMFAFELDHFPFHPTHTIVSQSTASQPDQRACCCCHDHTHTSLYTHGAFSACCSAPLPHSFSSHRISGDNDPQNDQHFPSSLFLSSIPSLDTLHHAHLPRCPHCRVCGDLVCCRSPID